MKNKPTLIAIIILLIGCIGLAIYGLSTSEAKDDDDIQVLDYATSYLDTTDKYVDVYINGTKIHEDNFVVNNKEYAFINKDNKVYLYSVKDKIDVIDYEAIKFYNTDIDNDYILVKREGKWGVLNKSTLRMAVLAEYDYLGLIDYFVNDKLASDIFITKKDNSYSLYKLSDTGFEKISNDFSNIIYTYNDNQKLLSIKDGSEYKVYDYQGNRFFDTYMISDVSITDNYIVLVDNNDLYIFDNLFGMPIDSDSISSHNSLKAKETNANLEIYIDEVLYKNIEI